jgi:hypothetical protein
MCSGLDESRAFSSLAERPCLGRHFVQRLNALGVSLLSSRIVRAALLGATSYGMRLPAHCKDY